MSRILIPERMIVGERLVMPNIPDVIPNAFNFTDVTGSGFTGTNTITVAGLGAATVIRLTLLPGSGSTPIGEFVKNGVNSGTVTSITNGDTLLVSYFVLGGNASNWVGRITNDYDSGNVIDDHNINISP